MAPVYTAYEHFSSIARMGFSFLSRDFMLISKLQNESVWIISYTLIMVCVSFSDSDWSDMFYNKRAVRIDEGCF